MISNSFAKRSEIKNEMNGAQILIKALEEQSVDTIFDIQEAVLEIYDVLLKVQFGIFL